MNEYIPFTDEQKRRANAMDLEDYLLRRGERLLPSGREKRLASDRSITIRGSEWFDHEAQQGGRAIDFVRMHDGCSFQEAVTKLLNGEQGQMFQQTEERKAAPPKIFVLPPAHHSMRRVYAYLMQQRHIDRDIITYFARSGTLYEDAEYHNAVFVGTDEHGVARHAQKRSTNSQGKAFKLNVEGSDARYSFHHLGMDGELYVCGTSYEPVRWMLTQMASPEAVYLCLDSDQTGQRACERMAELIHTEFCIPTQQLTPELKDWNEDLCALQDIPNRGPEMRMG